MARNRKSKEEVPAAKSRRRRATVPEQPAPAAPEQEDLTEHLTIQRYKEKVSAPLNGIRSHCVECMGGAVKLIKDCPSVLTTHKDGSITGCSLWPFRMGKNTLHPQYREDDDE